VTDLAEQICELVEAGARPVSLAEILSRAGAPVSLPRHGPARPRARIGWATAIVASAAAMGWFGAILAGQLAAGSHPAPRYGAVLSAVQVRQVTAASTAALARSARALITYAGPGPYHPYRYEYVLFSGQNYSFAGSVVNPAAGGRPGQVAWFAERIVNGQAYGQEFGSKGWRWFHYTGIRAGQAAAIPDPRLLLRFLSPSERFRFAGHVVAGGVPLERLQAADPANVPGLGSLVNVPAGEYVTALTVLVDRHDVVHGVDLSLRGTTLTAAARFKSPVNGKAQLAAPASVPYTVPGPTAVSVTFTDIGVPQTITAPPHAIKVHAPWGVNGRPLPPAILSIGAAGS
jgi:hypothetical protein